LTNVNAGGVSAPGMPILPHGMGAFYNFGGAAMGTVTAGRPITYGEYMAYPGKIIGAGVNFCVLNGTSIAAFKFKIFVANYTTGISNHFGTNLVYGGLPPPSNLGSISYQNTGVANFTGLGRAVNANTVGFAAGDYIGIYIEDALASPATLNIALEGTLYLNI
tara:strand:+ start:164 stop:652 length:489 start_codon:yes stop_codon:yes gene_type:complete